MQLRNLNQSFGKKQCQGLKSKMNWFKKLIKFITPPSLTEEVVVRARTKKGRYIADDPTTIQNEAYKKVLRKKTKSSKKK